MSHEEAENGWQREAAGHLSALLSAASGLKLPALTWTVGQTGTLTGHLDGRTDDAVLPVFHAWRELIAPGSRWTDETGADSVRRLRAQRVRVGEEIVTVALVAEVVPPGSVSVTTIPEQVALRHGWRPAPG